MKVTFTFGMPRSESHGLHLQSLPLLNRPLPCLLSLRWGRQWCPRSGRLLPGPWSWVPGLSGVGWRACETSILQLHTLIDLSVVVLLLDGSVCPPPPPIISVALLTFISSKHVNTTYRLNVGTMLDGEPTSVRWSCFLGTESRRPVGVYLPGGASLHRRDAALLFPPSFFSDPVSAPRALRLIWSLLQGEGRRELLQVGIGFSPPLLYSQKTFLALEMSSSSPSSPGSPLTLPLTHQLL